MFYKIYEFKFTLLSFVPALTFPINNIAINETIIGIKANRNTVVIEEDKKEIIYSRIKVGILALISERNIALGSPKLFNMLEPCSIPLKASFKLAVKVLF